MLAIESLRHRFGDRLFANIFRQHCRPRDGLEYRPMRAHRHDEREDDEDFAEAREHETMLVK